MTTRRRSRAPPHHAFTARTAVWSFGIMPPLMMPSFTSASAELGVMRRMSSMFASKTPLSRPSGASGGATP